MKDINPKKEKTFSIKRADILVCLSLIFVTLVVYWQVGSFEFTNFDDPLYVTDNPTVQKGLTWENVIWAFTGATTVTNYWAPVTWLTFLVDYEFYGLKAGGYHITNLLWHLANTLLLFLVFYRMTAQRWPSALVAALFALHPLHVESVAWITERKDVVSTFFWLLTMWNYCLYVDRPGLRRYIMVLVALLLGLMSKPMVITLPFALLLLDYWPLKRFQLIDLKNICSLKAVARKLFCEKIPFFALIAIVGIATYLTQEKGGVIPTAEIITLKIRLANSIVAYVAYLGKTFWPWHLAAIYPHPGAIPLLPILSALAILILLSIWALKLLPKHPYVLVGWLWYLGTLVPVIGLVVIGPHAIADRYTYVPLLGIFIIIVWGIPQITPNWEKRKKIVTACLVAALALLSLLSWKQVQTWKDSYTLFSHALAITEKNYIAHNNMGLALVEQGRVSEAEIRFSKAVQIVPGNAESHYNLANTLVKLSQTEEALRHYNLALRIDPDYADAHYNLANMLLAVGKTGEAEKHYRETIRVDPGFAGAYNNLGTLLNQTGRLTEAATCFSVALQKFPNNIGLRFNLALTLTALGENDAAIQQYKTLLRDNPQNADAQYELANSLVMREEFSKALDHYAAAIKINPGYVWAYNGMGIIYADLGKQREAIDSFSAALRIDPANKEVKKNLQQVMSTRPK